MKLHWGVISGNLLTINDKGLSRFHARLVKTDAGYTLVDLGSTNGTFVNSTVIIAPRALQNGDRIDIGENVTLVFLEVKPSPDGNASKAEDTVMLSSRAILQEELNKAAKAHARGPGALFSRWFEELWNKKNYAITQELVAPEFVAHGAGGQDIKQGPDGVAGMVKIWHQAFPDGHMDMDDITTEGEMSAIRMTFRGTQTGEVYGVPASNKKVEVTSIGIDRVVNGKISEGWGELNMLGMMQQMGAIPTPDQASQANEIQASITPEYVAEAYAALSSGDLNRIRQYWAETMVQGRLIAVAGLIGGRRCRDPLNRDTHHSARGAGTAHLTHPPGAGSRSCHYRGLEQRRCYPQTVARRSPKRYVQPG